jgi:hypothetical protein
MTVDEDGWCTPGPGQSAEDFIDEFVASRPPLTDTEITMLRAVFRPLVEQQAEAA